MAAGLDTPSFWQTGFQDAASPWLLNQHMLFLLCIAVLVSAWLALLCLYFFIGHNKPAKKKVVLSKEFTKISWVWLLVFVLTVPMIFQEGLLEIPVISLEQESPLPEPEVVKGVNPLCGPPEAANREMLQEVWWVIKEMDSRGYSKDRVLAILYAETPDEFWSLRYDLKVLWVQRYLDKQELSRKIYSAVGIVVFVVVMLWLNP